MSIRPIRRVGALCVLLAVTASSSPAPAQSLACAAIRPRETAAAVARRLTGDGRNRHEQWFQILDPRASRFVSKAHYDRIRPGWRACIVNDPVPAGGGRRAAGLPVVRPIQSAIDTLGRAVTVVDSPLGWWAALVVVLALTWSSVDDYMIRRRRMLDAMRRFGAIFVGEFERPLVQPDDPERPIRSRLRASVRNRRLEILLAPRRGRRYPNLSDHRKNVEYDVTRVLQRLRDQTFVCGPAYAQDEWVVVPFRFRGDSQQAGAK